MTGAGYRGHPVKIPRNHHCQGRGKSFADVFVGYDYVVSMLILLESFVQSLHHSTLLISQCVSHQLAMLGELVASEFSEIKC